MHGPVVQCSRVEVRSIGPDQRLDLGINSNLVEQLRTAQGAVQLAGENRTKINGLLGTVVEVKAKRVRRNDFERADSINRMIHSAIPTFVLW